MKTASIRLIYLIALLLSFATFNAQATGLLKNAPLRPNSQGLITTLKKRPLPKPAPFQVSDKPQIFIQPLAESFHYPFSDDENSPDFKADANSPAIWEDGKLVLFNSAGNPWRSEGENIKTMGLTSKVNFTTEANGGRWMEAIVRDDETGDYFGYYHIEPREVCPKNTPGDTKTAPKIGAAISKDKGRTWVDLGIIIEGIGDSRNNCFTNNHYFVGGHGDFSVALDREKRTLYFFFSSYEDVWEEQGVAIAKMDWSDRREPVGRVLKFWNRSGGFTQPGLKGAVSPMNSGFAIGKSWHDLDTDAYWGPSVHWNSHLQMWVMLLNHAVRSDETWQQEGVYVSYSANLEDPASWSRPLRIVEGGVWYPQVIGTQIGVGTDKEADCAAYFFQGGIASSMFYFIRPGESTYCAQ